jgi:predicted dehydrogenase
VSSPLGENSVVLKVAIVGAGLMGRWHSRFAKSCGAEIDAIVDPDEGRARVLADRVGCKTVFRHVDQLVGRSSATAVHLCTPTQTHGELIQLCLDAGLHVLAEKPLAENPAITQKLLNSAHEKGLALCPVHQFPFQRGYMELVRRKATLGNPVRVEFITCSAGGDNRSESERKEVMLEILPHPISLLYGLFGDALTAESFDIIRITNDDLQLQANVGETAVAAVVSLLGRPTRNQLLYIGDKGSAHLDLFHGYAIFEGGEVSRSAKMLKPLKFGAKTFLKAGTNLAQRAVASEPAYPGLRELISRFYTAVNSNAIAKAIAKTNNAPPISNQEILLAANLIERIRSQNHDR